MLDLASPQDEHDHADTLMCDRSVLGALRLAMHEAQHRSTRHGLLPACHPAHRLRSAFVGKRGVHQVDSYDRDKGMSFAQETIALDHKGEEAVPCQ